MGLTGKQFADQEHVDASRVSQWKKQGRLVLTPDGKIDGPASRALLKRSLDQSKGIRQSGNITSSAQPDVSREDPPPTEPEKPASARDDSGYWESKARREKAEAQLAEMKALQAADALTSVAEVKRSARDTARVWRNLLLAIPDDLAQILDPANPARAHKVLTEYTNRMLREFRAELEQGAAAAGAEEREATLL